MYPVMTMNHDDHHQKLPSHLLFAACRSLSPTSARAIHSLLYAVNLSCSYLLMLAIMTFNIGYFGVIVLGLALGNFLFGGSQSSDVCHTQS